MAIDLEEALHKRTISEYGGLPNNCQVFINSTRAIVELVDVKIGADTVGRLPPHVSEAAERHRRIWAGDRKLPDGIIERLLLLPHPETRSRRPILLGLG